MMGILDSIRELDKEKTISFSTHILQEVEAVAGRIVIINEGKVVSQGTQKEFEAEARSLGENAAQLSLEKIFIALLTQKKRKKKD